MDTRTPARNPARLAERVKAPATCNQNLSRAAALGEGSLIVSAGDTDAKTVALVALALNSLTRRCRNRAAREHLVIAMRAGLTAARVLERQERVMAREVAHA